MFFQNVTLSASTCATLYLSLARPASELLCYLFSLLCSVSSAVKMHLYLHYPVPFQRHFPVQPLHRHTPTTRRTQPSQMRRSAARPSLARKVLCRFSANLPHSRLPFQRPYEVLWTVNVQFVQYRVV